MIKRVHIFALIPVLLAVAGIVLGQGTTEPQPEPSFEVVQEIGRALPKSILYDPNFERFAVVDAYGRLFFMDALTYQTQHVLYEAGTYNDFAFSHDGRWFALAIGTRIELYDTQTGAKAADLVDPGQPLRIHGPLNFSEDDNLLVFYGTHRAPQSLRRTENDTSITPWIWNLTAARNEGDSSFPRKVEAWQFFDYRNGFVLGPDNRIVAALPGRLHIIDAYKLDVVFEIDTLRYEQDPMDVWFSLRDNRIYVSAVYEYNLLQVDTNRGVLVEIPLEKNLTLNDLETIGSVELSSQARVIGEPNNRAGNTLLHVLLGEDYRRAWRYHPLTVTLIDLITPPAGGEDRLDTLMFIYDEEEQIGRFVISSSYDIQQMILHPDGQHLMLRRNTASGERVEVFNMDTGEREDSLIPALRDLGYYSRHAKNRVLAYDKSGTVIVSDFQRFDAASGNVMAEDLRYSRRFERFFFAADNSRIVTLSGNEWRLWSIDTGEVIQRAALPLRGSVIATSKDGFRFLTQFDTTSGPGVEIYDVETDRKRSVVFQELLGRYIENIIPSPDWEHYFVIYSPNGWGPYYPSNEVAIYGMDEGQMWFIAGDDLPRAGNRRYGWVNSDTAYVYGEGPQGELPQRIFGADFAVDGTPKCLLNQYPDHAADLADAWYRATLNLRGDEVARLALLICDELHNNPPVDRIIASLAPGTTVSSTASIPNLNILDSEGLPACLSQLDADTAAVFEEEWRNIAAGLSRDELIEYAVIICEELGLDVSESSVTVGYAAQTILATPTPIVIEGVPACLTRRYPDQAEAYARQWRDMTAGLPPDQIALAEQLLCEGIGTPIPSGNTGYQALTMMIDVATGMRSSGAYTPPGNPRPLKPVLDEFYRTTRRQLGTAILSDDAQLVAASSLPGELIVYRLITPYQTLLAQGTATAVAKYQEENRIAALPTYTPTFGAIGTPRPTLTPTITPTPLPRPEAWVDQPLRDKVENFCPSETLYTLASLPAGYSPVGRLVARVQGEVLWAIEPEDGQRYPDETIPKCSAGISCRFSPDEQWILADTTNEIFVVRPDGSDERLLFDKTKSYPYDIWWSGARTLEYEIYAKAPDGSGRYVTMYQRDILGVFPDPEPWWPNFKIRERTAELISRQPGGSLAVARLTFSTGINPGYEYYIYNTETGEATYFARLTEFPEQSLSVEWHPLGDRLFYAYPTPPDMRPVWYLFDPAAGTHRKLGSLYYGTWSLDGRYVAYSTGRRAQQVGVWDSLTGLTRTYCVPETGARLYEGSFTWSPDSRYLALQTSLPKDENAEGVGQHTLILDIETGSVTDLTTGLAGLIVWTREPGSFSAGG